MPATAAYRTCRSRHTPDIKSIAARSTCDKKKVTQVEFLLLLSTESLQLYAVTMASPKLSDAAELSPEYDSQQDDFRSIDPESGVKRGLKTRHISLMALAGTIGPGLLVGAGSALSSGGPASLLIGFGVIGMVAFR